MDWIKRNNFLFHACILSINVYWGCWCLVHSPSVFILPVQGGRVLLQECALTLCPSQEPWPRTDNEWGWSMSTLFQGTEPQLPTVAQVTCLISYTPCISCLPSPVSLPLSPPCTHILDPRSAKWNSYFPPGWPVSHTHTTYRVNRQLTNIKRKWSGTSAEVEEHSQVETTEAAGESSESRRCPRNRARTDRASPPSLPHPSLFSSFFLFCSQKWKKTLIYLRHFLMFL